MVKQLFVKYYEFFLQETLLTQFNTNKLDQLTENNTKACFTWATPSTYPNRGRHTGVLAVFWKTIDTIIFFPLMFTNRVKGLKVQTLSHYFLCLVFTSVVLIHIFFHFTNSC